MKSYRNIHNGAVVIINDGAEITGDAWELMPEEEQEEEQEEKTNQVKAPVKKTPAKKPAAKGKKK